MQVKNILNELAKVPEGEFLDLLEFNGHQLGASDITGISPYWEMHPDTDELFYVLEGQFEITLLTADGGSERHVAKAGDTMVVPMGLWHKPAAPNGAKFIYLTPGQSLHSDADDPRQQGTA